MPTFPPVGAPTPRYFVRLQDSWPVAVGPEYADGGRDTFWGGGQPTRRWIYETPPMTAAEAASFVTFVADMQGTHLGCTFTFRDGVTWANVKIESYESGHLDRPNGYKNGHFYKFRFVKYP